MLVLTVRMEDEVIIHRNGEIIAVVKNLDSPSVRLGFSADGAISIDRAEVYDAKYPPAKTLSLNNAKQSLRPKS